MTVTEQAIKERPILMKSDLVRATLEGRKTQTRRVIKNQPQLAGPFADAALPIWEYLWVTFCGNSWGKGEAPSQCYLATCPQGRPGERLWVKETFWQFGRYVAEMKPNARGTMIRTWRFVAHDMDEAGRSVIFNSPRTLIPSERGKLGYHKRPSLFMERWMSRATVEITGVRVERVQDISHRDALAEGVAYDVSQPDGSPLCRFRALWDQINGPRGFGWDQNPWCWVIEYRLVTP